MEQILSTDGTLITFRRSGAGKPLLLVHGATADHGRWDPITPHLEEHYTVCAMDRRGRGGSGDSADYDFRREAEDVAAVVEAIGEPTFVLGHSLGAICSLEAVLLTDKISRLILYEPPVPTGPPQYPPDVPTRMQALIDGGESEAALEVYFREVVKMPERELEAYRRLPAWEVRIQLAPTIPRELAAVDGYRFVPRKFSDLPVPTMLLLGGDSPQVVRREVEIVDAALPDSRITVLPGQQHIAMDTAPERFVEEVLRFFPG